jgi:ABC-type transport system substrate-binding protein
MNDERALRFAMLGGLGFALLLLVVVLVQLGNLEARFVLQGQELRALGEATDRLRAGFGAGSGVASEVGARANDELLAGVKLLHPEVANFLKPADVRYPPEGAATNGVLFRSYEFGDPKGFNPLFESSAIVEERIFVYVRSRLAERNGWTDPDTYYGTLAVRVEITDDSKEFTAYLRPGVKWHPAAGVNLDDPKYAWLRGDHEVTAHDFVFTLDLITNPQVQAGRWKQFYAGLERYQAIDDRTLVMRWKRKEYTNVTATVELWATPRFLYAYDEQGKPFPKETLGLRVNEHFYNNKGFVGAGPYRMASYEPGSKIVLERNESYFGQKPAIKELVYPIYSDAKQTLLKLRAHELGDGELMPGQYREEIHGPEKTGKKPQDSPFFDGRIECRKVPRLAYSYFGWNAARPLLSDKRVRRAMTHALDRQRIIDNVWAGLGTVVTSPFAPGSPNADPAIQPIPFDLGAARKLLAEAGFTDTDGDGLVDKELHAGDGKRSPFEFRFTFPTGQKEVETTIKIFADDLLKIGVRATLEPLEWSAYVKRLEERQFDASAGAWSTPWLTDLYQAWHSSQVDEPKGSNAVGFRNAQADDIIEKLRVEFDKDARIRLFRAFHRIVDDEQPYTFVMRRTKVHCAWSNVKNVVYSKEFPPENSLPWWVEETAP